MKNAISQNFILQFEQSVKNNWDSVAVREFPGKSITYKELAESIEALHAFWAECGLKKGDKIAICARNSCRWVELYMAIVTAGYVAVLLPATSSVNSIKLLLAHSDSRFLYVDSDIVSNQNDTSSLGVEYLVHIDNSFVPKCCNESSPERLSFASIFPDDICTLVYTSGSSGIPKGCMLSVKNITANFYSYDNPFVRDELFQIDTVLPFSHVFGLIGFVILPLCFGAQDVIMTSSPTPANICTMMAHFKPAFFSTVPLVLLKVIEYIIGKSIEEEMAEDYSDKVCGYYKALKEKVQKALGGNINVFYSGGASMPLSLELFLNERIGIPCISGYGLSESGLITAVSLSQSFRSSGKIHPHNEVRIVSENSDSLPGEIQVKGDNVFVGYYKNDAATLAAFTVDGWFHTGDLGYIDQDGFLYITGRCKHILLTSNGENIYPEDIETYMNASPYVNESILVQRGEKLHAIVVPNREKAKADSLETEALNREIDKVVREASKRIPDFTIISSFELRDEPLERTPKGSLKRYLYSDGIKEN